jgi:hypothetical protein
VTIILGGDSLIHNKTKDPEINRGFAATPRGCDSDDDDDDNAYVYRDDYYKR